MEVLAAVPVKPFGVAKARLGGVLDAQARERLGKAIAANTVAVAATRATAVAVVTADDGVARWAAGLGADVIRDPGAGLNGAAVAAADAATAQDMAWAVIHADLPMIAAADVEAIVAALTRSDAVIAPSHDGGTNVLAGRGSWAGFSYGVASFHRHLRQAATGTSAVLCRPGLALDLDTPADLARARGLPGGRWLSAHLG